MYCRGLIRQMQALTSADLFNLKMHIMGSALRRSATDGDVATDNTGPLISKIGPSAGGLIFLVFILFIVHRYCCIRGRVQPTVVTTAVLGR